jgi:hypothetical protein
MAIPALELLAPEAPIRVVAAALAARTSPPALGPSPPHDAALRQQIQSLRPETMFAAPGQAGPRVVSPHDAMALLSGLLLWNDCLDESHHLSQGIETPNGSYWHGVMHRREPDYANSKYWFRRVGAHPIFPALRAAALEVLRTGQGFRWATETAGMLESSGAWDASAFIDWCQACEEGVLSPQTRGLLEQIQLREIELLMDHCLRGALVAG